MAEALYTKYRPQVFNDMVGQEHIERTIKNAIEHDKVSHAYLFTGPRGTGKTTTARLLAKALLCDHGPTPEPDGTCENCKLIAQSIHPDVSELDAASRTGVDNVREEIIGRVNYAPTRGRYKVYIIDEVHMLSTAAFNALLKTLEEPPSHVVFILCTTDPQKVPETIHSRCQRFDFHRISIEAMVSRLGAICVAEGVEFEGDALELVAHRADGGMRNALTSLEQLIAFGDGKVTLESAERLLGSLDTDSMAEIVSAIGKRDAAACFTWVSNYIETGADLAQFANDLAEHIRDLYILSLTNAQVDLPLSDANRQIMTQELQWFGPDRLSRLLVVLGDLNKELRTSLNTRLSFEIALTRMIRPSSDITLEALAERIEALERNQQAEALFAQPVSQPVPQLVPQPATSPSAAPQPTPQSTQPAASQPTAQPIASQSVPQPTSQSAPQSAPQPASFGDGFAEPVASTPAPRSGQKPQLNLNNLNAALSSMRNKEQTQAASMPVQAPSVSQPVPASAVQQPSPVQSSPVQSAPIQPVSAQPASVQSAPQGKPSLNLSDPAAVQRLWHQTTQRMNKVDPTHGILFISGKPSADESGSRLIITYAKESAAVFSLLSSPAVQKLLDDTLAEVAGVPVPFELVLSQPDPAPAAASVPTPTPIPDQTAAPAVTPVATSSFASALDKVSASAPASASASTVAPDPADAPPLDVYDSYAASYSDPSEPDYGYGAYGDPSEPDYQPPMQPAQSTQPAQPTQAEYQQPATTPSPEFSSEAPQAVDESQRVKDLLTDVFGTGVTFENLPPK